jgi:hypothetical protein
MHEEYQKYYFVMLDIASFKYLHQVPVRKNARPQREAVRDAETIDYIAFLPALYSERDDSD